MVCLLTITGALGITSIGSAPPGPGAGRGDEAAALSTDPRQDPSSAGSDSHPSNPPPAHQGEQPGASTTPHSSAAPDPGLPAHSGSGKRVVFGVGAQRVWLVNAADKVVRTYPVSGSKYDNLNLGTYHVSSVSRVATAYNSQERLPYMVRFAYGRTAPIGFHAIPVRPDGTLVESRSELGKPMSDGCIRAWITDARALWNFAPVGTTVVVHA